METTPVNSNAAAAAQITTAAASASSQDQGAEARINADFDTFLSLLTAQLRNQDPLKPVDSTEFIAQLAQFSAVEQQIRGNDTLDTIASAVGGNGASALAPWLGTEVAAPTALKFRGDALSLSFPPKPESSASALIVRDLAGNEVTRVAVDARSGRIDYVGNTANGGSLDPGSYRFSLVTTDGQNTSAEIPVSGFSAVTEARAKDGQIELLLASGDTIPADNVTAVRSAENL